MLYSKSHAFIIFHKRNFIPVSNSPSPLPKHLTTTFLFSASRISNILDKSYKWNQAAFVCLRLAYFTGHKVL